MSKFIDLTGEKFGKLTVVERKGTDKHGGALWLCKCECGNEKLTTSNHLRMGKCSSCGCLQTAHMKELGKAKKHGYANSDIYKRYHNIISRCFNPNVYSYTDYGSRGITVCERWRNSFEAFYDDVSKLPHFGEKGYSLDRIDNNGNYEPNNVRWATKKEQNNNTRNNHYITYNGKTQTISQWADEYNIGYRKLLERINKLHWNIERALNTP